MMFPCSFLLLAVAVFKGYAEEPTSIQTIFAQLVNGPGNPVPVTCSRQDKPESLIPNKLTHWHGNHLYSVEVCATVEGASNIETCDLTHDSHFTLEVETTGEAKSVQMNTPLFLNKFVTSKTICRVYYASEIAAACDKRVMLGSKVGAHAITFGTRKSDSESSTVQAAVQSASYHFTAPGNKTAVGVGIGHHSVVCDFKNCLITGEGPDKPYEPLKTERFTKTEKGFPEFFDKSGPFTEKMFSVTSYNCHQKCPSMFVAAQESATSKLSAFYLSIGSVILAVLTSQY